MTVAYNPTTIDWSQLATMGQNLGGALGQHNLGTAMQSALGPDGKTYDYDKMIAVLAGRNPLAAAKLATDAMEAKALAEYRMNSLKSPERRLYEDIYGGGDEGPPMPGSVQAAGGPQSNRPTMAEFYEGKKGGTPGEIARDKEFGKELADWRAGGGFAAVDRQLGQLGAGVTNLEGSNRVSGPVVGSLPDAVNYFVNPEAINTRQVIEESIQSSLRKVLGAQYTQLEGENLLKRTFDPRLDEKTNATRARRVMHQLRVMAKVKDDAANYFEQRGTLRGWDGQVPTMDAFDPDAPTPDEEGAKNQGRLEANPTDPTPMTGRSFVEPVMGEATNVGVRRDNYGAPQPKPEHIVKLRQLLSQYPNPKDQQEIMEEWERKYPQYGRGAADHFLGRDVQAGR